MPTKIPGKSPVRRVGDRLADVISGNSAGRRHPRPGSTHDRRLPGPGLGGRKGVFPRGGPHPEISHET
jgi:hypothetical protein